MTLRHTPAGLDREVDEDARREAIDERRARANHAERRADAVVDETDSEFEARLSRALAKARMQ